MSEISQQWQTLANSHHLIEINLFNLLTPDLFMTIELLMFSMRIKLLMFSIKINSSMIIITIKTHQITVNRDQTIYLTVSEQLLSHRFHYKSQLKMKKDLLKRCYHRLNTTEMSQINHLILISLISRSSDFAYIN